MNCNKVLKSVCIIFLLAIKTHAQFSNMVIFTQENEPFTVIMNGIQQSPDPQTNVKITGLNAPSYKVKVLFDNKTIPEINKTVYLKPEVEVTCQVLKNKKGLWVLRMTGSAPVDEVGEPQKSQDVYIYSATPRVSTSTVSQTTTVRTGGMPGGASITTTTTQTTSGVSGHEVREEDRNDHEAYSGPRGCPRPMSSHSFDQAVESISSKSFESSKLTIAKQIVGSNCLRCQQVKEVMKLFTFESNRLDFAKFAYKYTWDVNNYFVLNDAFEFESSIEELNRYINATKTPRH
ncbi:MAG: DUF4476 domain-containing protein [Bacteroidetes bacterium]|nr:DUF4476 domain-containing protein [Bacteroidota bacterium]